MKNIVIVTARGGNASIENKNVIPVLGVPIMLYPIRAAKLSHRTDAIYVSTENDLIRDLAEKEEVNLIDRPESLSQNDSAHKDVIRHAVEEISELHPEAERFIVLLGNTVMVTPQIIDRAWELLEGDDCDSVMTVWHAEDDHPYRALKKNDDGYMESFMGVECGSNRQSYPSVYFYDQGIWAFEKSCAIEQNGPIPWVWLGKKCRMIERPWVTGRDVHSWIDLSASLWYLNSIQTHDFQHFKEL
ncbi:NTP transferase domain-containing protein [Puniceicoccaceae bacterium K14]|nr:NTP transferase domain-containing protein [Puniceicoccaceae bacterium K14]